MFSCLGSFLLLYRERRSRLDWEAIYAELANKLRWSISSTGQGAGIRYTFPESMACANYAAADILKIMKIKFEKPDYVVDQKGLKNVLK